MKKLSILFVAIAISLGAKAQSTNSKSIDNADVYCAKMKDGILIVTHQGNQVTTDVLLDNSSTIKSDGTIITRDGNRVVLKEGECIDQTGTMISK